MSTAPYVTDWERRQHAADNGQLAGIAQGYKHLGAYLEEHGQQDRDLLGVGHLDPEPLPYMLAIPPGDNGQGVAAVSRFAEQHHVTAHWDAHKYTWRAVVWFGPIRYVAYTIPSEAVPRDCPPDEARPELAVAK